MSDHAPSVAAPADPLLEAWRQYTIRFATAPEVRNSETSIRDAFAAGWDAAALRAESVAAPVEPWNDEDVNVAYGLGYEAGKSAARHAPPALDAARDLPDRVVVGKNGAYWRDYGTHYSMCPVSEDNDPVVPVAVYVRSSALDAARLTGALMEAFHDLLEGEDEEHRMDMSWWRNMARVVADAYGAATPASGEPAPGEEKE